MCIDAGNQPHEWRRREIQDAVERLAARHVPVVPVRMTEAWLLFNEAAILAAAGNPNGSEELGLPRIGVVESIPDPKSILHEALKTATGHNARRRSQFRVEERVHRIVDYIDEYSALEGLPAFRMMREDIRAALDL